MAQERTETGQEPIHINFRSERQVVITPGDEDRFLMTAREAAQACKRAQVEKHGRGDEQEWIATFKRLLLRLGEWCEARTGRVETCYLDVGDGCLNVLISAPGDRYDYDLDDEITDLDVALNQEFPGAALDLMQVPAARSGGQLSHNKAIAVYADGSRTPPTGQAQP